MSSEKVATLLMVPVTLFRNPVTVRGGMSSVFSLSLSTWVLAIEA